MIFEGRRCATFLLATSVVAAVACSEAPDYHVEVAAPAPPVTRTLAVGTHRVKLTLPAKWRHDDRGAVHGFGRSIGSLSVSDLGPVTPAGLFDAITRAQDAFRDGDWERAQAILATFDPGHVLADKPGWPEYKGRWQTLRWARSKSGIDLDAIHAAYADLLNWIYYLPLPDSAGIFDDGLALTRHDNELREVASSQKRKIGGREACQFETWNRRSHTQRRSHLFVLDGGYLLLAQMEFGVFEELEPEFAVLVDSLELD